MGEPHKKYNVSNLGKIIVEGNFHCSNIYCRFCFLGPKNTKDWGRGDHSGKMANLWGYGWDTGWPSVDPPVVLVSSEDPVQSSW